MKRLSLLFGLMMLTACVTPYQHYGAFGGFREQRISENTFIVSTKGNSFTQMDRVQTITLRRAAELTAASGYRYFTVIESHKDFEIRYVTSPGTYKSTSTAVESGGGNTANTTSTTKEATYTPSRIREYKTPYMSITMETSNTPPAQGVEGYDAAEVLRYTSNLVQK